MTLLRKVNSPIQDEESIILLANKGKIDEAFRLLTKLYQERLYWHVRKMVTCHADTHDILQNTLIKVYKNLSSFKGESKLYTWMYRIATNECITFINREKKKGTLDIDEITNHISLEADSFHDENKTLQSLKDAINTLPDKQKQVFAMRYFEEMSYKEISELLGTSVGGLKASYHHAVQKIESFIKAH